MQVLHTACTAARNLRMHYLCTVREKQEKVKQNLVSISHLGFLDLIQISRVAFGRYFVKSKGKEIRPQIQVRYITCHHVEIPRDYFETT